MRVLRSDGYTAEVVEYWNSFAKIRKDLFGVIDIVAVRPGETLGVQTTSYSNISARVNKILAEPKALDWLQAGNRLIVHGWKGKIPPGKKRKVWTCTTEEITEDLFGEL